MKVNGTYVKSLLDEAESLIKFQFKTFEAESFELEHVSAKKVRDFSKEGFVMECVSNLSSTETLSSRKDLLEQFVSHLTEDQLDNLIGSLVSNMNAMTSVPVSKWLGFESSESMHAVVSSASDIKAKMQIALQLLSVDSLSEFKTCDHVAKSRKKEEDYKLLHAPLVQMSKKFASTGAESLPSITKSVMMHCEDTHMRKLATNFAEFVRKNLYHCFREADLKLLIKTLENDEIIVPNVSTEKRKAAMLFYDSVLSILKKYLVVDNETTFWTLQEAFNENTVFFDVKISEGGLLEGKPKIRKVGSVSEVMDNAGNETPEETGKYESEYSGGAFSEGFNPSKTKFEQRIEKESKSATNEQESKKLKRSDQESKVTEKQGGISSLAEAEVVLKFLRGLGFQGDLNTIYKSQGLTLSGPTGKPAETVEGFPFLSLGKPDNTQLPAVSRKLFNEDGDKRSSTFTSNDTKPFFPASTRDVASKTEDDPNSKSVSNANEPSTKSFFGNKQSKSNLKSSPTSAASFFKKGKKASGAQKNIKGNTAMFSNLRQSPLKKEKNRNHKYLVVKSSLPLPNYAMSKFQIVVCVTAMNDLARGDDHYLFEFRPNINNKSFAVGSVLLDHEMRLEFGSDNKTTEKILNAGMFAMKIRQNPGSMNNANVIFDSYSKYQSVFLITLDAETQDDANKEAKEIADEFHQIVKSPDWWTAYKIGCYWQYVAGDGTDCEQVLNEIGRKATDAVAKPAGQELTYAYIKNGFDDVFTKAKGSSGLYKILITDENGSLSRDIGNNKAKISTGLRLDEMLIDGDIGYFSKEIFEHREDAREKLLHQSKQARNWRILCSSVSHHRLALKQTSNGKNHRRLEKYFEDAASRSFLKVNEVIYNLFLDLASFGVRRFFDDLHEDPFYATSIHECKRRTNLIQTEIKRFKRKEPFVNISDETRKKFCTSSKKEQHEIYETILFESKNMAISVGVCKVCNGKFTYEKEHVWSGCPKKCQSCKQNDICKEDIDHLFPVWYKDNNINKPQYNLPDELKDLTLAEKLLIQLESFLIPCVHMGKGKFGLCAHSVFFARDNSSVCTNLPRCKLDVINMKKRIVNRKDAEEYTYKCFKVRRKKVLRALLWLKEHNIHYKDITIVEENLDWMNDNDEDVFSEFEENEVLSEKYNNGSISREQTTNPSSADAMEMCGIAVDRSESLFTDEAKATIDSLKTAVANAQEKGLECSETLLWPDTTDIATDEFNGYYLFAKAYPWLFPGGVGDVSKEIQGDKTKALAWTKLLLQWEDGRFQKDPCFTFHSLNYIQRHLNNGSSISLYHSMFSNNTTVQDIKEEIENGNFFTVGRIQNFASQRIRGCDGWWRARKHELDSWISYHLEKGHGPPTLFMTFSCAEYWWKDLRNYLISIIKGTPDEHYVQIFKDGTEEEKRKAQSYLVDEYTASVQVFFQRRLNNWLETIGKEVFNIKHYFLRFEFAKGRGQIHAHMVAITTDVSTLTEFHEKYVLKGNAQIGADVMSEYARNVLSLTEEYTDLIDASDDDKTRSHPLETTYSESTDHEKDYCLLCQKVHMHECSDYCLSTVSSKTDVGRICRMNAGQETIPGDPKSTPGFELHENDEIEKNYAKQIHVLKLKRNHSRLKQTSTVMLNSWRANCDVSVILYATDPLNIVPSDIAQISGYIMSYCTKGNLSYQEERNSIASIISKFDYEYFRTEKANLVAMTRKALNSLLTSRVVSKAEASVELLDLELYWCTESAKYINLTGLKYLLKDDKKNKTDPIQIYKHRPASQFRLSFVEYMAILENTSKIRNRDETVLRQLDHKCKHRYIHPVGFNCAPCFPPSLHYAMTALVLHKPWHEKNRLDFEVDRSISAKEEFNEFLNSEDCPQAVRLQYCIAKANFEMKLFKGKLSGKGHSNADMSELDESKSEFYDLVSNSRLLKSDNDGFYKGDNGYDFQKQHYDYDASNESGKTWLKNTKKEYDESELMQKTTHINPITQEPYKIEDTFNNEAQEEIVFAVLSTLKEWIEFPDNDASSFKPLILTIRGAGGTGKSFLIRVLVNAIEKMFSVKVTATSAPTGCAAYNIDGKTIHSLLGIDPYNSTKELSQTQKDRVHALLNCMLMLIIDERSMMSLDLLHAVDRNCSTYAHGTGNSNLFFGGIPIVLLFGDDFQLPPVAALGAFDFFNKNGFKNDQLKGVNLKGAQILEFSVQKVKSLTQIQRIETGENLLRDVTTTLRSQDGVTKKQAEQLCKYNIDNPDISTQRQQEIKDSALWVYTTKEEVARHNESELRKIVNENNPLMDFTFDLLPTDRSTKQRGIKRHFQIKTLIEARVALCRGARVSLNRNVWQRKGLFNGAIGTVIDIRFDSGQNPLHGDLPVYIVIEFQDYCGPPWDEKHPKYVPIPVSTQFEDSKVATYGCCKIHYYPLDVAFARTLHKVQGLNVGSKNPISLMTFHPGSTTFEGNNPGLAYTGISRATSLGRGDVNSSALYFCCETQQSLYERLRDVVHKRKRITKNVSNKRQKVMDESNGSNIFHEPEIGKEIYEKVKKRNMWTQYLDKKEKNTDLTLSDDKKKSILKWYRSFPEMSYDDLKRVIHFHKHGY